MKNKRRIGEIIKLRTGDENYTAYVPRPLPPMPALALEPLYPLLDRANLALGRLDGMSQTIPDASLFLYMYGRRPRPRRKSPRVCARKSLRYW